MYSVSMRKKLLIRTCQQKQFWETVKTQTKWHKISHLLCSICTLDQAQQQKWLLIILYPEGKVKWTNKKERKGEKKLRPGCVMALRSPTELTTRTMKDAIGGLSLVRFDISGNNLTNKTLFFSTDKCLHFKPENIHTKIKNHTLCSNMTPNQQHKI